MIIIVTSSSNYEMFKLKLQLKIVSWNQKTLRKKSMEPGRPWMMKEEVVNWRDKLICATLFILWHKSFEPTQHRFIRGELFFLPTASLCYMNNLFTALCVQVNLGC